MKKHLLIILSSFLICSSAFCENIVIDTESEWNDGGVYSDTQGYSDGLRLRSDDSPSDFVDDSPYTAALHEASTDLPDGVTFQHSRKVYRPEGQTDAWFTPGSIIWANGPYCRLGQVDIWLKAPYHKYSEGSGGYYVINYGFGHMPTGVNDRNTYDASGRQLANPVVASALDEHTDLSNGGAPYIFDGSTTSSGRWGQYWYGRDVNYTYSNNTWIKYSYVLDWVNQNYTFKINDTLQSQMRRKTSDSYSDLGASNFLNQGFWPLCPSSAGACVQSGTRDHISYWQEIGDYGISSSEASYQPFTYYIYTNWSKLFVYNGTYIKTFSEFTETPVNPRITWVSSIETDSNITTSYTRSWCSDSDTTVTASTEATGYEATKSCDSLDSTSWRSTQTTGSLTFHFSIDRAISKVEILAAVANRPTGFTIETSSNGVDYTTVYTGSSSSTGIWDCSISTPTASPYMRISFTGSSGSYIDIKNITMRSTGDDFTSESSTSIVARYRVSTNGGSSYGSWSNVSNGGLISEASGITPDNLRVQVELTLKTDNPTYRPVISSLTWEESDYTITSLSLSPLNQTINVAATQQMAALNQNSTDVSSYVTWTSSHTGTATISSSGLVTGVSSGTSILTATSGSISARAKVTVTRPSLIHRLWLW